MSACVMCQRPVENEASTGAVCRSCFDAEHVSSADARTSWFSKIPVALIVAFMPFVATFRTSSSTTTTVNGEVVASSGTSIDYVAVALGPLAILLALGTLKGVRELPAETRNRTLGFALAALVVGAYQLYRGLH